MHTKTKLALLHAAKALELCATEERLEKWYHEAIAVLTKAKFEDLGDDFWAFQAAPGYLVEVYLGEPDGPLVSLVTKDYRVPYQGNNNDLLEQMRSTYRVARQESRKKPRPKLEQYQCARLCSPGKGLIDDEKIPWW